MGHSCSLGVEGVGQVAAHQGEQQVVHVPDRLVVDGLSLLVDVAGGQPQEGEAGGELEAEGPGYFPEGDEQVEGVEEEDDFAGLVLVEVENEYDFGSQFEEEGLERDPLVLVDVLPEHELRLDEGHFQEELCQGQQVVGPHQPRRVHKKELLELVHQLLLHLDVFRKGTQSLLELL